MSTLRAGVGVAVAGRTRALLEPQRAEMVRTLGDLVDIESPSDDPDGLARMAAAIQRLFGESGSFERHPGAHGEHLVLQVGEPVSEGHLVALCHYDTVWPTGTIRQIPFSVDADGIARGPGCFDMKGGIVVLLYALRALREIGEQPRRSLRVVFNADEEIGSLTSRSLIEQCARGAAGVLVLESPLPNGMLKTARKGTGDYHLTIQGRAAHAGVEPQKGINAIQELAHQVQTLHALTDYDRGTTVTVGVVRGGTRPNVVPAAAEAEIDVRVATLDEAARLEQAILGLKPILPGASLTITGGLNRPPMERTEGTAQLFELARAVAAGMGVPDLQEGSTGGGSDGNFTAAMGIPTLDGLGVEGEGPHAANEQVVVESFPRRAALIAGLLAEI